MEAALQAAIDNGVTSFDTAPFYGFGLSEELIGQAVREKREQCYVATKVGLRWDGVSGMLHMKEPFRGVEYTVVRHAKAESILWEVDQSLARLGTDYIDLLQYHHPDPDTPLSESLTAMHQVVEQGKVRHLGVSNLTVNQIREVLEVGPITTTQNNYSLLRRDIEDELVPFCIENGIEIICYGPLGRGLLTGHSPPDRTFPEGDFRLRHAIFKPENLKLVNKAIDSIRPTAEDHGCNISQLVLAWTLTRPGVGTILVGIRNPEQAVSLAGVERIELSPETTQFIDETFRELLPKLKR